MLGCGGVPGPVIGPLHVRQSQGAAVVRDGFGDEFQIGVGQAGIDAGSGQIFGTGLITLDLHLDGDMVQSHCGLSKNHETLASNFPFRGAASSS